MFRARTNCASTALAQFPIESANVAPMPPTIKAYSIVVAPLSQAKKR